MSRRHRYSESSDSPVDEEHAPSADFSDHYLHGQVLWADLGVGPSIRGTGASSVTRSSAGETRLSRRMPKLVAVGTFLVVSAFGIGIAIYLRKNQLDGMQQDLAAQCQVKRRAVHTSLVSRALYFTRNLAALAATSPELTLDRFNVWMAHSSWNESISIRAVVLPVMSKDQIPLFEKTYKAPIWNPNPTMVSNDSFVLPAAMVWPNEPPPFQGCNFLADSARRNIYLECAQSKMWRLSEPILLAPSNKLGFRLIYCRDSTINSKMPFVTWVASIGFQSYELFPAALASVGPNASLISVRIYSTKQRLVFATDTEVTQPHYKYDLRVPLDIGHYQWTMQCGALEGFEKGHLTPWPWVVGGVIMVVALLLAEIARRAALQWQVSKRVLDEYANQERFLIMLSHSSQTILEMVPDGLLVLDARGRISAMNSAALHATAYASEDKLIGKHISDIVAVPQAAIAGDSAPSFRSSQSFGQSESSWQHQRQPSGTDFYLVESAFEARLTGCNGASFMARFTVSNIPKYEQSPVFPDQHSRLDTTTDDEHLRAGNLAQIVLFHDVTQRATNIAAMHQVQRETEDAKAIRLKLLELLSVSLRGPTLDIQSALDAIVVAAPTSVAPPSDRASQQCGLLEKNLPLATSFNQAHLQDAQSCLWHVAALISDIAVLAGVRDDISIINEFGALHPQPSDLGDLIEQALAPLMPALSAKHTRMHIDVSPAMVAASSVPLAHHILTRLFTITSALSRPSALYLIYAELQPPPASELRVRLCVSDADIAPLAGNDLSLTMLSMAHASRGSEFSSNIALGFVALHKLVDRRGGQLFHRGHDGRGATFELYLPLQS